MGKGLLWFGKVLLWFDMALYDSSMSGNNLGFFGKILYSLERLVKVF